MKQSQEVAKGAVTPASVVEMVDRLTRQVQDLQDQVDRCIRLQQADPEGVDMEIPGVAARAGTWLYFDDDGNPTYAATVDTSGAITTTGWSSTFLTAASAVAARGLIGIATTDPFQCAGLTATTGTFSGMVTANNGLTLGAGDSLVGSGTSNINFPGVFTVAATSGNTLVQGTLTVNNMITANNGLTLGAGDSLVGSATSNITMNTNKFTVAGATGNTLVAGTLDPTGGIFGAHTQVDSALATMLKERAYLTMQDGFVTAYVTGSGSNPYIQAYVDTDTDPYSGGATVALDKGSVSTEIVCVSFPVAKGKYFELRTNSTTAITIFWHPLGTLNRCVDQG
jgi:hypothetical protein